MDYQSQISHLRNNKQLIENLVRLVTDEQASWRPSAKRWTLLEILNHLLDIEKKDFKVEFNIILNDPNENWPQFDIEDLRIQGSYNTRNRLNSLNNFLSERDKSLRWLESLDNPPLDTLHSGNGFKGKPMRAGDVLLSWVAHDFYHIRHLTLLNGLILNEWNRPFSSKYSGAKLSF